jgi:hypothetical protein
MESLPLRQRKYLEALKIWDEQIDKPGLRFRS